MAQRRFVMGDEGKFSAGRIVAFFQHRIDVYLVLFSMGAEHLCAVRADGSPVCWSWCGCDHGECDAPEGPFRHVRAGDGIALELGERGEVEAFSLHSPDESGRRGRAVSTIVTATPDFGSTWEVTHVVTDAAQLTARCELLPATGHTSGDVMVLVAESGDYLVAGTVGRTRSRPGDFAVLTLER